MYAAVNPLGAGLVAAGLTTLSITLLLTFLPPSRRVRRSRALPQGAETALWSVVEAVPDPRNVLALTRDLSGEVRITDADRAGVAALLAAADAPMADAPQPEPVDPGHILAEELASAGLAGELIVLAEREPEAPDVPEVPAAPATPATPRVKRVPPPAQQALATDDQERTSTGSGTGTGTGTDDTDDGEESDAANLVLTGQLFDSVG